MNHLQEADVAAKTCDGQQWTQDEIDAVERAKEQQRRREQEANQQRDADAKNHQAESTQ
jgi:hypothetical protein